MRILSRFKILAQVLLISAVVFPAGLVVVPAAAFPAAETNSQVKPINPDIPGWLGIPKPEGESPTQFS
jgi:hypothetical protein